MPVAVAAPGPLTPAAPRKVARLITSETVQSSLKLAEDGKLPELHLGQSTDASAKDTASGVNPLVYFGLICLSVVATIAVLLMPMDPEDATREQRQAVARQTLKGQFFSDMNKTPSQTYQVLLREAHLAHYRGDHRRERDLYRRVLDLLRSEADASQTGPDSAPRFLTGSPTRDRELEKNLVILLDEHGGS
jgi:hypothetical protein